jgi:myo-inositol-1(or 4)-monophosphatase
MSSDLDLDSIYTFAIQLGKDAGQLLQDAAQRRMSGEDQLEEVEKLNSVDIVTKTDEGKICLNIWEVEAFIRESVLERYPSHKYVGYPSNDILLE